MNELFQFVIISLKILTPSIILKFPFFAVWGNYFLDVADGDILLSLGMNEHFYQTIDKFTDLVSYCFMLLFGLNLRIRKVIVVLFIYRMIGQILFFITGNEIVFFYFQNLLEPLLMIYTLLLLKTKSDEKAYKVYKKYFILIWIIVIGYKMWNEWYLHYANIDLSLFFFGFTGGK